MATNMPECIAPATRKATASMSRKARTVCCVVIVLYSLLWLLRGKCARLAHGAGLRNLAGQDIGQRDSNDAYEQMQRLDDPVQRAGQQLELGDAEYRDDGAPDQRHQRQDG